MGEIKAFELQVLWTVNFHSFRFGKQAYLATQMKIAPRGQLKWLSGGEGITCGDPRVWVSKAYPQISTTSFFV
jgi:hypothetical protein